ncbi:tetratricopeptide repeat protein [Flavobacterium chungnamense]|uniref:Tetratricopeptide repeat protein n=1 Tax=Flavobacterium chungnamense TaxID=706182 RepID=A0ABP7V0D5_9FLAO
MKINPLIIFTFLLTFNAFACLNGETKILKNGAFIYEDYQGIVPNGHNFNVDNFPRLIKQLDSLYKATNDLDYLSDKGYVLIISKKYLEALDVYFQIEKIKPNRYSTASNIGTIYELLGKNKEALNWINKSIQINPKSHKGSEWIHSKILEAKIRGEKYITSNFLINLDSDNDRTLAQLSKSKRKELINALYYQLNERVSFIKDKDKIIAQLLFDLANLLVIDGNSSDAVIIYIKAEKYGYSPEKIHNKIINTSWKSTVSINKKNKSNETYKIVVVVQLVIILILLFLLLKRKKTLK